MNGKFFEVLLAAAVLLSASDWSFKGFEDVYQSNAYNPEELPNRQVGNTNRYVSSGNHLSLKEENDILNTIINLEEEPGTTRIAGNTNFLAYPLLNNHTDDSSYNDENFNPDPQADIARPSSWLPSPPSPIDDGGLFGAIGYAPLSDNQYFDIESFLSAEFPSDIETDDAINDLFGTASATTQTSIRSTSGPSETIDELAEFLGKSIESPTSPEYIPKTGPRFLSNLLHASREISESAKNVGDSSELTEGKSAKSKISETGKLLKDDYLVDKTFNLKGKESPIAGVQSYDHIQKPSVVLKKRVKKEPISPSDSSLASHSNDYEFEGYGSSSSSSLDASQSETRNRETIGKNKKKQIWLDLPYTKDDIISSKIEDFNSIVSLLDPLRQHVAKEIRRKGKNKLAARNCRKRKIDAIDTLGSGVNELEKQRQLLLDERLQLELEREEILRKTEFLYEHIFKNLRDERGLPYSKDHYSLTYTADGSVYLVPKTHTDTDRVPLR